MSQTPDVGNPPEAATYWRQSLERLVDDRLAIASAVVLMVLAVLALASPLVSAVVTHHQPDDQDLDHLFTGITTSNWLGTDELGRDTLTRLVYGARVSLGVAALAVAIAMTIGATVGMLAGYYGGVVDDVLMRLVDILLAIPAIYLLILLATFLPLPIGGTVSHPFITIEHSPVSIAIVIAATSWGGIARLVRGEALSLKNREFVLAARAIGASGPRIMFRHLLPNALPVLIVSSSLGFAQMILLEAALDFIGIGVQPPTPTWGNMLGRAQEYFYHSWLLVLLPGACIAIAVLAANIFGNGLRDALDPRLR